jgi:hypothetical protein
MEQINIKEISQYIETNIGIFHEKRIRSLDNLKLDKLVQFNSGMAKIELGVTAK